jgi:hypothetical protein
LRVVGAKGPGILVIVEAAHALTDIVDADRATRLEARIAPTLLDFEWVSRSAPPSR